MKRRLLFALVFVIVVGGGGGWYLYSTYTDPQVVRQLAIESLEQSLPGYRVTIEQAEACIFGGLTIQGVKLAKSTASPNEESFLEIESIKISPDRGQLLEGKLAIRSATVRGPTIRIRRDRDGKWVLPVLAPRKGPAPTLIDGGKARVQNARVLIELGDDLPILECDGIDLDVERSSPQLWTWQATGKHVCLKSIATRGQYNSTANELRAELAIDHVMMTRLRPFLDRAPPEVLALMNDLQGHLSLALGADFIVENDRLQWVGPVQARLSKVSLSHPKLPFPLENGSATASADLTGLDVRQMDFRLGTADVHLDGRFDDWTLDGLNLRLKAKSIPFCEELYSKLPENHQRSWDRFLPEGFADVDGVVRMQDGKPLFVGKVSVRDFAVTFYRFPYRASEGVGSFEFREDRQVLIDGQGKAGGRPAWIRGRIFGPEPIGIDLDLGADGVRVDQEAYDALPSAASRALRNFEGPLEGDVRVHVTREAGTLPVYTQIEIDARSEVVTLKEWFPYTMHNVTGHITVQGPKTTFRDFRGKRGNADFAISGQVSRVAVGTSVDVTVRGTGVPLDAALRDGLPPTWRPRFEAVDASGTVDMVTTVRTLTGQPSSVRVRIDPANAAIRHVIFPYKLEGFQGHIDYVDQKIHWKNLIARHGESVFRCDGRIEANDAGGQLWLGNLNCGGLVVDDSLRDAVPSGLQTVVDFVQPNRPISVSLREFSANWSCDSAEGVSYAFDGAVAFRNTDLIPKLKMTNATGRVTFVGSCTPSDQKIIGNIDLPSMTVAGFTAEEVTSQLSHDNGSLRLPNIRGSFYNGRLHGEMLADCNQPKYELRLNAFGAELADYVRQSRPATPPVAGLVDGYVYLTGAGREADRLNGSGWLTIRQADIYHLPLVFRVFDLLNSDRPSGPVFDTVDCDFRFRDQLMILDQLNFVGPSLTLTNEKEGRINLSTLDMDIRLAPRFRPRWAKGQLYIPLVTDTFNTASDQLISIRVRGKLDDPTPEAEPVPGLRRLLQAPGKLLTPKRK